MARVRCLQVSVGFSSKVREGHFFSSPGPQRGKQNIGEHQDGAAVSVGACFILVYFNK
jgi:hypothetical protein